MYVAQPRHNDNSSPNVLIPLTRLSALFSPISKEQYDTGTYVVSHFSEYAAYQKLINID